MDRLCDPKIIRFNCVRWVLLTSSKSQRKILFLEAVLETFSLPLSTGWGLNHLAPLCLLRNSLSSRILVALASCLPVLWTKRRKLFCGVISALIWHKLWVGGHTGGQASFELYRVFGHAENFIQGLKAGFFGDRTSSSSLGLLL